MSLLSTLVSLSGAPGLEAAVSLLTATYTGIENVKLYKQQCQDMGGRCLNLMVALQDSSRGLEGSKIVEIADEIEAIISRINRKVKEWGSWSRLKSFLQQREIKDGIDRLHRDIDAAMMKFSIQLGMEMNRGQLQSKAIQARDNAEIRDVLQIIVRSQDDMKALLSSSDSRPVEEMMESLQTHLMDPDLQPTQEEIFKAGLWQLHESTSKLPPLTDLTGQVTLTSQEAVMKGAYNDVFLGQWLDKASVALRYPRALANSPEVQDRFQREVAIWRELDHPNVVPLYGIVHISDELYSVSPWMNNGTIMNYVKRSPQVDRLKLLCDAATGLEFLHQRGIVHGDLRGANVLITKNGVACLSDFGLSKFLEDCGRGLHPNPSMNSRWHAPELIGEVGQVSTYSDVWSFGMVCLEVLSGEAPFSDMKHDDKVRQALENGNLPERPGRIATSNGLSTEMWTLMCKCWHKRPESRPSISNVKASLLAIRGMTPAIDSKPTISKRFGIFRKREDRPSTSSSSSDTSVMSSASTHKRHTHQFSPSISIPEAVPPLFISTNEGLTRNSRPKITRPHTSSSSSQDAALLADVNRNISQYPISPLFSTSHISPGGPPRLELPHLSVSSPARIGAYFPAEAPRGRQASDASLISPLKSASSSDSGVHFSGPVHEAKSNTRCVVYINDGTVSAGSLEGLVQRLITNFNSQKDREYRDALLTACADFAASEDLFGILSRHFYQAESIEHPEDRVAVQYNILLVITYWISHRSLPTDVQLLRQMSSFCDSAIRMKTAAAMIDKAEDLKRLIEVRLNGDPSSSSIHLSPGRKMLSSSQIKPQDLAIALTLLEGDKYKALLPSDYIAHLGQHQGYNNVKAAYTTNNKIIAWVKDSVLHYDSVEKRADVLKFFINTAIECRKLRNFSSLVAITTALHSSPVESLKLTKSALTLQMQGKLDALYDIINPSFNHRGYREALNDVASARERDCCVPWLAVHLKQLHIVLQNYPMTVHVDGQTLVNFQRYIKLIDRIKEVVHYRPPDLESYRNQGQLAYLENQLRNLKMSEHKDDELVLRSELLRKSEERDYRTRKPQLRTLGFRV
ncbi:unnamed protein product [Cyclocybe aegerita]|uniref:Non-specific serine/threonine protein kinase n=1 Tax=Cyclocybe aegerita TaxID=1973307 RepID=A0A8S0XPB5_CYCAE|nr:unnamed protein product [Cyclocybe aegerita]